MTLAIGLGLLIGAVAMFAVKLRHDQMNLRARRQHERMRRHIRYWMETNLVTPEDN